MKFKNIALIDSNYTLLLYYLLYPQKVDYTLFIVSDGITPSIRKKLKHFLYLKDTRYFYFKKLREMTRNIMMILSPTFIKIRTEKNICFYGQDHAWFSFIGKNKRFILLEDGLDNYEIKPKKGLKRKFLSIFGFPYLEFGRSDNVINIILTGLKATPKDIKNKTTIIDIDKVWDTNCDEIKTEITTLFIDNLNELENLQFSNGSLILTQPLNQDGIMSENDKINCYKSKVSTNENIYYKRHPRDSTRYNHLGWTELKFKNVPIELLILLGLNFKKVITYSSTSVYRFKNSEKIIVKDHCKRPL